MNVQSLAHFSIRTRLFVIALTMTTLMIGAAWPSVTVIDAERGRVEQSRQDLQREIRSSFAERNFDRVLVLCDQLEDIHPQSGIAQHYRMMANERIARGESQEPPQRRLPRQMPTPPQVVEPATPEPTTVSPPPQETSQAAAPSASNVTRPAESSESGGWPLIGKPTGMELVVLIIATVAILIAVVALIRLIRRVRAISATLDQTGEETEEAEEIGAELELAPPSEEEKESWESEDTSAFDEAFAPAPEIAAIDLTAPFDPEQIDGVAALIAPHTDLESAIAAIRASLLAPPEPEAEEEIPEVQEASPISLDAEVGPSGFTLDEIGPEDPPATDEAEVLAFQDEEKPDEPDSPEIVDPDEMLFGENTPPPPIPPAGPAEDDAPTLELDAVPAEENPDALAPPMSTEDLLEGPVTGGLPNFEGVDKETTLPPLSLEDVLTNPPEAAPTEPVATVPSTDGPLPPPPGEGDVEFDPDLLDDPITPTPPATAPRSGDTTMMLKEGELSEVLGEIPPPEETMSASSNVLPDPEPDPLFEDTDHGDDTKFMELYRHGLTASEASDWPRAVDNLKEALDMRPNSAAVKQALRRAENQAGNNPGSQASNEEPTPGL